MPLNTSRSKYNRKESNCPQLGCIIKKDMESGGLGTMTPVAENGPRGQHFLGIGNRARA